MSIQRSALKSLSFYPLINNILLRNASTKMTTMLGELAVFPFFLSGFCGGVARASACDCRLSSQHLFRYHYLNCSLLIIFVFCLIWTDLNWFDLIDCFGWDWFGWSFWLLILAVFMLFLETIVLVREIEIYTYIYLCNIQLLVARNWWNWCIWIWTAQRENDSSNMKMPYMAHVVFLLKYTYTLWIYIQKWWIGTNSLQFEQFESVVRHRLHETVRLMRYLCQLTTSVYSYIFICMIRRLDFIFGCHCWMWYYVDNNIYVRKICSYICIQ